MSGYVPIIAISISADEDSPYWSVQLQLTNASDYGRFTRDQPFTAEIMGSDFSVIVDSRNLSRGLDESGNRMDSATVTGLSVACKLASPRATTITKTWTDPVWAQDAVEEVLGQSVDWQIINWLIPGLRLAAVNAAPMDLAKRIAEAAGGLIESNPDGTIKARYRFPVSVKDYASATPDLTLTERDIYAVSETPVQDDLRNRFRLIDVETSLADRLEWTADTDNPLKGTLRAFPSPWRDDLSVVTTRGTPPIVYWRKGEESIEQTETIEFIAGHASVKYPIMSVSSVVWLSVNLGGVAFNPYASDLMCTAPDALGGYSLATVVYTTRGIDYGVECLDSPVDAQFLLVEEIA